MADEGKVPSIKAVVLRTVLTDLQNLIAEGKVSKIALDTALTEGDRELLRDGVLDSAWVPIDRYERIYRLLARSERGGSPAYYHARAMATADRLLSLGVYKQLDFSRAKESEREDEGQVEAQLWMLAQLRITATMWNAVYNFGTFEARIGEEPGVIEIVVRDCQPMPEISWDGVAGFIARLLQETGTTSEFTWHRPKAGVVILRLTPTA